MKFLLFFCFAAALSVSAYAAEPRSDKEKEIRFLEESLVLARDRIRGSSTVHAGDFLAILPSVSVSRRSPFGEVAGSENETYIGISVNSSQLWSISEKVSSRETLRRTSLRRIEAAGFAIRTLIERKYLFVERIWKLSQMRLSMSNPVDVASIDEKIDEATVQMQECAIAIERSFADIEAMCAEAGR